MNKNDTVNLKITDVTADGFGVGRYENMAVFVPNSAVGDEIKSKIVKVCKTYAFGRVEEIITPSDNRIPIDCPVFSKCGGCVFRHISYESETDLKYKRVYETVKRIGGIDLKPEPIVYGNCDRYRNKAQYPISKDGNTGFFAVNSHRVIENKDCLLQNINFTRISDAFCEWIKENNVSVYNEETKNGLLRHLYLRMGEISKEIMATVVVNGNKIPKSDELVKKLCEASEKIASIVINENRKPNNVVLGDKFTVIYGKEYITDVLCGIKVRLSPASFYQVNHDMAEKLYEKAKEYAQPHNKNILDLYCGTGTIGLTMAKEAKSVIGVEIVPEAVKDAKLNAEQNGIGNARFICSDAANAVKELKKENITADTVILDPPRKGCDESLLQTVANGFSPERIVYVSCDVATLARDIKILSGLGYALKEYTPFDLFPRTAHVETVALLKKTK